MDGIANTIAIASVTGQNADAILGALVEKNIFDGKAFSGCICLGDDMDRKLFIKKTEDGVKVRFSKGWDKENIEMLLEVLRRKRG